MTKYTKKPVTIEAFKLSDCYANDGTEINPLPLWFLEAIDKGKAIMHNGGSATIQTLEGYHLAHNDHYIIQGIKGEIYPCKPDIFEATYTKHSIRSLSFGRAIEAMRAGNKATRKGWNGKNMFVKYVPSEWRETDEDKNTTFGITYREHFELQTAQGDIAKWSPSTSDALADDWEIVN